MKPACCSLLHYLRRLAPSRVTALELSLLLVGLLAMPAALAQSQPLACETSPFGDSLLLGADREVAIALLGAEGSGLASGFVYSGTTALTSEHYGVVFTPGSVSELKVLAVDLNGDGVDETVYAGRNSFGQPDISIYSRQSGRTGTWTIDVPATDVQIAAVRYDADVAPGLALAFISGQEVHVYVIPTAGGGIPVANGQSAFSYRRLLTSPRKIALATGDFLLGGPLERGPEQIALTIAGRPSGNRAFVELLRYAPGNSGSDAQAVRQNMSAVRSDAPTRVQGIALRGLRAARGRFGYDGGDQLALAIQHDLGGGPLPTELWLMGFDTQRDADGRPTGATRIDLARADSGNLVQAPNTLREHAFAMAAGDLSGDGLDAIITAWADDSGDDAVRARAFVFKPGTPSGFAMSADLSYPLSLLLPEDDVAAADVRSVDVAAADTSADGIAELYTAIGFGPDFDLRRWEVVPASAALVGAGCDSPDVIGSPQCPGSAFLPAPVASQTPIRGEGFDLGRFRGQSAFGDWTLCAADSALLDAGSLRSLRITVNGAWSALKTIPALAIPDGTGRFDTCFSLNFPTDLVAGSPALPVDGLQVDDIDIAVGLDHTFVGDLTLRLSGPRGTRLTLLNRPGRVGEGDGNSANLVAATPLRFTTTALPRANVTSYLRPGFTNDITRVALALPDWDGDSARAVRPVGSDLCRRVREDNIRSVVFMPPVFGAVQNVSETAAFSGRATLSGREEGVSTVRSVGLDVSAYIGATLDAKAVELSARVTAGRSWESSEGRTVSSGTSTATTLQRTLSGDGVGLALRLTQTHDCYQYPVLASGNLVPDTLIRFCDPSQPPIENAPSVLSWNRDVPTQTSADVPGRTCPDGAPCPEWAPLVRDWENLALSATVSSNPATSDAARAIDGLIQDAESMSVSGRGHELTIDLGSVQDIYSIRLHVPPEGRLGFLAGTPSEWFDANRIWVYQTPRPTDQVPFGVDVRMFNAGVINEGGDAEGVLGIHTVVTIERNGQQRVPVRGRFVRIRANNDPSQTPIVLTEVQVFGSGRVRPDRSPVAVCDVSREDDWFQAKVWNERAGGFRWVDVAGSLEWVPSGMSECPDGQSQSDQLRELPILLGQSLNGESELTWEMEDAVIGLLESSSAVSYSSRIGAELDLAVGTVLQLNLGGGVEKSAGVGVTHSSELFWERSLNVGGSIPGIADSTSGANCDYIPRPFAYRGWTVSNTGFEHRGLMIDYLVEPVAWTHGAVPALCTAEPMGPGGDGIFASGFEQQ